MKKDITPHLADYCRQLVCQHDYYRYISALFLKKKHSSHVMNLLAFHYEIAKIQEVTSEPMTGYIRLQWWRDALTEIYSDKPTRKHEVVQPLAQTISTCNIPHQALLALIDAREADVEFTQSPTLEALENYCNQTSSKLLLLLAHALGECDKTAEHYAFHIGIAWGLMGVIRNLRHDASKQHIRLPLAMLEAHQLTNHDIIEDRKPEALAQLLVELTDRIAYHLKQSADFRRKLPKPIQPLFYVYYATQSFLRRVKSCNHNVLHHDIEQPRFPVVMSLCIQAVCGWR